jgi:glycosyltransferase involved in cell wall biosynthesis
MDSTFINLADLIRDAGLEVPGEIQTSKKKFMIVGTHTQQVTGYSKVTYHMIQELAKYDYLELYHFGFQKFAFNTQGYREYPAGVDVYDPVQKEKEFGVEGESGFGFSQLPAYVRKVQPDCILIYNDAGVICRFLEKLATLLDVERTYKLIVYLDQVYTIQRPELLARIDKDAHVYFAFTQYWKEILQKQGIKKPIHILRHGFDPKQFVVMDRQSLRLKHSISPNAFVILNLNRNTPRKHHDLAVMAFAKLIAKHPDQPLLMLGICDGGESGGYPLLEVFIRELSNLQLNPQQHGSKFVLSKGSMTFSDSMINELYCLSDIGINTAEGEGFGLCQFEAMGVGVPQVVSDVGGFKDFCVHEQNSLVVPVKWRSYLALGHSALGGIAELVDPEDVCLALERYLLNPALRVVHGQNARTTVCSYTWEKEVAPLAQVLQTL